MYREISNLISALSRCGALKDQSVGAAIREFAECLHDVDFRSHMLGEMAVKLAEEGGFQAAEEVVRTLPGLEKSGFITKVAEVELRRGEVERALSLYDDACRAAMANRFPTQQGQEIANIAQSIQKFGPWSAAANFWRKAVEAALDGQLRGGTDGPEAAGVLVDAVEAFSQHGESAYAHDLAQSIVLSDLREQALKRISG